MPALVGVPGPAGSAPGGGGCLVPGGVPGLGVCVWPGGCLVETPLGWLLLRVVRILLECILVLFTRSKVFHNQKRIKDSR